jgi:quercetin dioxygenase-like cupin family protein
MTSDSAVIIDQLSSLEMTPSRQPIYDRPMGIRHLYTDPETGAEHYVVRYPRGLKGQRHRHTAAHTIIVLEGKLKANGHIVGPGSYCHFVAGEPMHHAPADNEGCLFVIIFDGPFDLEPLETTIDAPTV